MHIHAGLKKLVIVFLLLIFVSNYCILNMFLHI
jgi:hypothetical protein